MIIKTQSRKMSYMSGLENRKLSGVLCVFDVLFIKKTREKELWTISVLISNGPNRQSTIATTNQTRVTWFCYHQLKTSSLCNEKFIIDWYYEKHVFWRWRPHEQKRKRNGQTGKMMTKINRKLESISHCTPYHFGYQWYIANMFSAI